MKGFHKVPFRMVYCQTWRDWIASCILCHIVYKISTPVLPEIDHG